MKFILDTDHVSILQRPGGSDYAMLSLNLNLHVNEGIGIAIVSVHEQTSGAHARINSAKTDVDFLKGYDLLNVAVATFRTFPIVPLDAMALTELHRLKAERIRIGAMDLRLAAVALVNDLTLVTRNTRHFELVAGLKLVDWTK
jgi:tRNA(fMet)-specific endonuclease VapC